MTHAAAPGPRRRGPIRRLVHRIGRRGYALLFCGTLGLLYAFSLMSLTPAAQLSPTVAYARSWAPLPVWAGLWGGAGLLALVQAWTKRDRVAFAALSFVAVLWGLLFLAGWLFAGLDRGWVSAVVWLGFASLIYVISTWPEPREAPWMSRPSS